MIDNKVEDIKKHIEAIMEILELDKTVSNENTPLRISKMYCNELFRNRNNYNIDELNSQMKVFPCEGIQSQPVTIETEFHSVCEHHWLPFMGDVIVTYIPNNNVIGLSKIPRVVKFFSQKPQLQERLTAEIGKYLVSILDPQYLSVRMTATHTCVICRGVESPCKTTSVFEYSRSDIKDELSNM